MLRKNSPQLKAELNAMLARYPEGSAQRNMLLAKYLKSTKWAKEATSEEELGKFERTVAFFRQYGDRYDMDYLLMMAQGYQESQLNQAAKSPVGAVGVMQVMPTTGEDMAVGDIRQVEDPHWRDNLLFYEYFHGDNGAGLGASHQTGWTGIIARGMHLFATSTAQQVLDLGKLAAITEVKPAGSGQPGGTARPGGR